MVVVFVCMHLPLLLFTGTKYISNLFWLILNRTTKSGPQIDITTSSATGSRIENINRKQLRACHKILPNIYLIVYTKFK